MNTRLVAIAAIVIIVVSSFGVFWYYQQSNSSNNVPPGGSLTVTDDEGNILTLSQYPDRIVSLAPANTQVLFAIGAGDKVVGVTDYDKYPYNFTAWVEAGNMSSVGSYYQPAIEPILELDPDLVVASLGSIDAADQLRSLGCNVLTLNPDSLSGIMEDMLILGNATGCNEQAKEAVAGMQLRIDVVVNGVKTTTNRPTVYHEIWSDPYMSIGNGSFITDLINMAGGQNIFENATEAYPVVSSESIIEEDPQVMVFPTQMGVDSFWGDYSSVAARDGWGSISAIVNNKMYTVSGDIIDEPGPRLVNALEILAQIIHPEIFGAYNDTS